MDALKRLLMLRYLSRKLNLLLVTEYPKSGGTWLSQMLSEALDLPFPRNRIPKLETCVMQGHHLYHPNYTNVVCLFRDGRDVMVSAYFHYFFENEHNLPWAVEMYRKKLGFKSFEDIQTNLPRFIEFLFEEEHFSWSEFVNSWKDKDVVFVKYEELLDDCSGALGRICNNLNYGTPSKEKLDSIAESYSFRNMKKQHNQEGKSFLRKGKSGDWVNHFSKEAKEIFNHYGGKELIQLGYEKDHSWMEKKNQSEADDL